MDANLTERLLNSIHANRLALVCGAGLSMAEPSKVPSAVALANMCADEYAKSGNQLPAEAIGDLEKTAEHFQHLGQLYSTFVCKLLPRRRFLRDPNKGHYAIADFLSSGVIECAISTNFDTLIEEAARELGELNFQPALDGGEANIDRGCRPHLKIHGCMNRDERNLLWCKPQLHTSPIKERNAQFSTWLAANLRERDIVFVGFWSDWAYLNFVLEGTLGGIQPGLVVIVNKSDEETLKEKAPGLWACSQRANVSRFVVNESADVFLDELRSLIWKAFQDRVMAQSMTTYGQLTGLGTVLPPTMPATLTSGDLYALRLDDCGVPQGDVARLVKRPDESMQIQGAVKAGLLRNGATVQGSNFKLSGETIRVVNGHGQLLSNVRNRFSVEIPSRDGPTLTICASAKDDGGVLSNIARSAVAKPTIVRPSTSGTWVNEDGAQHLWRQNDANAAGY